MLFPREKAPPMGDIKGKTRVSTLTEEKEAAPRPACTMAGDTGASAR
jgi:hypothetical protein